MVKRRKGEGGTNDGLFGDVEFGGGVADVGGFTDAVDFVVDGGTVMVTVLTSTSDSLLLLVSKRDI